MNKSYEAPERAMPALFPTAHPDHPDHVEVCAGEGV